MEKFFESGELTEDEIRKGLNLGIIAGEGISRVLREREEGHRNQAPARIHQERGSRTWLRPPQAPHPCSSTKTTWSPISEKFRSSRS